MNPGTLLAFYLFNSAFAAVTTPSLFSRQDQTCGGIANLQQCGNGFPSSFCCPKDTACMNLNSGSVQSVICCPSNSDCAFIQTITCDVSQLDATLHPDNQMHLSDTSNIQLPKCGDKCCPLGYTCKGSMCSKDPVPSPSPSTSSPTTSSSASASSTNPASQTAGCLVPPSPQGERGFDGRSFAAGFFPGIVIGALGTIGLIWLIKKRRETQYKAQSPTDYNHVARQISDPIYDPEHAARTDFIRRGSRSAQNSPDTIAKVENGMKSHTGGGLTPKIKSMWDRTPKLNFGFAPGLPSNPAPPPAVRAGTNDPYTTPPPKQHRRRKSSRRTRDSHDQRPGAARSGSSETIDVLMPAPSFLEPPKAPGMRENRYTTDSANTTFTKLMERAGFDESGQQEVRDWRTPPRR
jgi:hypothetical protein